MTTADPAAAQAANLATVRAWIDAYNRQDFDALAALADADLQVDDPATGTHLRGWPAFRHTAGQIAERYPDRRITVTDLLALGQSAVAVQGDWTATVDGETLHHVEAMVVELVAGRIARRRIYR